MIDFFRNVAVASGGPPASTGLPQCATFATCKYDVTDPAQVQQDPQTNVFTGPDGLQYVYTYFPSRNDWIVTRQDRNIATFKLVSAYNTDINATKDDGTQGAYSVYEYPIRYTIDSYNTYERGY